MSIGANKPEWNWADQISVYQFWGLLGFLLFALIAMRMQYLLPVDVGLRNSSSALLSLQSAYSLLYFGSGIGLLAGWLATRSQPLWGLATLGGVQVISASTLGVVSHESVLLLGVSFFCLGLAGTAILLAVPAILAGGRAGTEAFAILFGIALFIQQVPTPSISRALLDSIDSISAPDDALLAYWTATVAALGLLFLIPVKRTLFDEAPPQRHTALIPQHRHPIAVALLCLVPFYAFYWLYRVHGEATSVAAPAKIPAPWAATLAALFVPFAAAVLLVKLFETLRETRQAQGQPPAIKTGVMCALAILLFPVGAAVVQWIINNAVLDKADVPPGEPQGALS
ncbi:hypothetical protein CAI21_17290 [Alkalilimnicola ehrlichii]|uniref:hypothetical protein n=1 Tax=Alkalilimnicola ehrlichii TaxID=351052 RepID=UPI000E2FADBD|nr:hypothetical protein [Alkalilimnicola ehrlichii]RFA26234.1 hypothetical protein CAI21_17290 [Alkalilimnicola ehrlichii]